MQIQLWNTLLDQNHHGFMMQTIDHVEMPAADSKERKAGLFCRVSFTLLSLRLLKYCLSTAAQKKPA